MTAGFDIKKNLETEYDIPFTVERTLENSEPCYWITPTNSGKELFTVKISFRNHVRLTMEFLPQKYSANFIRMMGMKPKDARQLFLSYLNVFESKGAKCVVLVNRQSLNHSDTSTWPANWNSFEARITKMPIVEDGDLNYERAVDEWGSLMIGMILSLTDIIPLEPEEIIQLGYAEGNKQRVEVNKYERNPLNRKLCLALHGYACKVCGFDFVRQYGSIGAGFIHVHHITPVSLVGTDYIINPQSDLIPVCPNCHAMLHRQNPPLFPAELKVNFPFSQSE